MMAWYMTVFPTVLKLVETRGCRGVILFEDTCLLAEGVDYRMVAQELEVCVAGVFCSQTSGRCCGLSKDNCEPGWGVLFRNGRAENEAGKAEIELQKIPI